MGAAVLQERQEQVDLRNERSDGADVDVRRHLQDDVFLPARHATAVLHLRRTPGLHRPRHPRTSLDLPGQDEQAEEVRVQGRDIEPPRMQQCERVMVRSDKSGTVSSYSSASPPKK